MQYEVIFTPFAENNIIDAYKYYFEEVSEKIAERFNFEIQNALDILEINPYFRKRTKNYRAYPLKKIPFIMFFEIIEEKRIVKVLAVFNTSQNSTKWP